MGERNIYISMCVLLSNCFSITSTNSDFFIVNCDDSKIKRDKDEDFNKKGSRSKNNLIGRYIFGACVQKYCSGCSLLLYYHLSIKRRPTHLLVPAAV